MDLWLLFITNLHQVQWAQNHSLQPLENDKQNPYAISIIVAFCNCFNCKGSQVTKCIVVNLWTCAWWACLQGSMWKKVQSYQGQSQDYITQSKLGKHTFSLLISQHAKMMPQPLEYLKVFPLGCQFC